MNQKKQMSETVLLGILLAGVGGFLDVYTYICRGGVFANAQTGNIVLFGAKLAERDYMGAMHYLIPIMAFVAGVILAEIIKKDRYKENRKVHWRQIIICFEVVVLGMITFVPQGEFQDVFCNVMVSFVCSLQVQTFRRFDGNPMATTMCTGNLRSATEHIFRYFEKNDSKELYSSLQYLKIITAFIVGAVLGAIVTGIFITKALLFACALLMVVFFLMFIEYNPLTDSKENVLE